MSVNNKAVAAITSLFGKRGYTGQSISRIQEYSSDSALDTDTDQWSITIGDPGGELIALLKRDSEVRVKLALNRYGGYTESIISGYADTIGLTENGTLSLTGRDLSAAAVDTTAIPQNYAGLRPDKEILRQARLLGFSKFNIAKVSQVPGKFFTDGSESVWEMWYRWVRKKKVWIWVDHDGTLHVSPLNYAAAPSYLFGKPNAKWPDPSQWIPIQSVAITKNTQNRVYEVQVFGESGNKIGFGPIIAKDTFISDWIKKPLKIISKDAAHTNQAEALREAQEEIFESIVGALEITIRIADPGFIVRQNQTCYLNIPDLPYEGEFFVVGVRVGNGSDGAVQEIRLREKKYALSRRAPNDPQMASDDGGNTSAVAFGQNITTGSKEWGDYFFIAGKEFHGGFDLALFIAVLLAICKKESSFTNVRERKADTGGVEWSPLEDYMRTNGGPNRKAANLQNDWKKLFANAAGNALNPFSREAGVGPMQLTTASVKHWADDRMGIFDEYAGGRWHPSANIWAAAKLLSENAKGLPPTEANMWIAVAKYNGGNSWQEAGPQAYMRVVRGYVLNDFLQTVTQNLQDAKNSLPAGSTKTLQDIGKAPDIIRKMINFAERQEGKPYSQAHDKRLGPTAYDCSGLVYACYKAVGLDDQIGGAAASTTYGFWNGGKGSGNLQKVSADQLLPGDMVFFDEGSGNPPEHMGLYYHDNLMIVSPTWGRVVFVEGIYQRSWTVMGGMRLPDIWAQTSTGDTTAGSLPPQQNPHGRGKGRIKVMIQAGHDPGSHSDQPYGHEGESGAPGEVTFTKQVRDHVLAFFDSDERFDAVKGTAWSASAGATSSASDDIDFDGELFVAIHYDAVTAEGSRYFFGWPRDRGTVLANESIKLRDSIRKFYDTISSHPPYTAADNNSNAALWGYYAWGSPSRAAPDDVNHVPNVNAAVLIECGEGGTSPTMGDDHVWLTNHVNQIAKAIYYGICDYYYFHPVG